MNPFCFVFNQLSDNWQDKLKAKLLLFIMIIIFNTLILTLLTNDEDWSIATNKIEENHNKFISKVSNMFHFTVTTFSTAGYGDIFPITIKARTLANILMFSSFFVAVL